MNKGFSLVELIVVIAIMAILVGVAVPVYTQYISSAEDSVDKQTAGEVEHAIEVLLIDPNATKLAGGTEYQITLSEDGTAAVGDNATLADFVVDLKELVPGVETKEVYTFTIEGYSVSVNPSLVKDESSATTSN